MSAPFAPDPEWGRYAHETWGELDGLIKETWSDPRSPGQRDVVDGLLDALARLHLSPTEWRALVDAESPRASVDARGDRPEPRGQDDARELALATAEDRRQRAVECWAQGLDELMDRRLELREWLAGAAPDSPLRHVRPWIWRPESTGTAISESGRALGMELRLSWHSAPMG